MCGYMVASCMEAGCNQRFVVRPSGVRCSYSPERGGFVPVSLGWLTLTGFGGLAPAGTGGRY